MPSASLANEHEQSGLPSEVVSHDLAAHPLVDPVRGVNRDRNHPWAGRISAFRSGLVRDARADLAAGAEGGEGTTGANPRRIHTRLAHLGHLAGLLPDAVAHRLVRCRLHRTHGTRAPAGAEAARAGLAAVGEGEVGVLARRLHVGTMDPRFEEVLLTHVLALTAGDREEEEEEEFHDDLEQRQRISNCAPQKYWLVFE